MLIDTHCHLNDAKAYPEVRAEIDAALEAGVARMLVVGIEPGDWELAIRLAEEHSELFAIVGWHPNRTADFNEASLTDLEVLLEHPRVLALGEIGLDYHWNFAPHEVQHRALCAQLELARSIQIPVVFHAREAYSDLLTVLEGLPAHPYLFHCWAGDETEARRAMSLDAYFGVDGPITYKKADALRSVLQMVPRERIVLETDAPYMSPVPYRGKPNRPAYVPLINRGLAEAVGLSEEECAKQTTANALRFFGSRLAGSV